MNANYQNTISIALLCLFGLMVLAVLVWVVYRFVLWIRHDVMGIAVPVEEQPKSSSKHGKSDYEKIKPSLTKSLKEKDTIHLRSYEKDKDMMISELNFNDEDDRESDAPEITAEQVI